MRYNITIWIGKCDNTLHYTTRHVTTSPATYHLDHHQQRRLPQPTTTPTTTTSMSATMTTATITTTTSNITSTHWRPPQRRHRLPRQRDNHNHNHIHRGSRRVASRVQVCFFFLPFLFSYYMLTRYFRVQGSKMRQTRFRALFFTLTTAPPPYHLTRHGAGLEKGSERARDKVSFFSFLCFITLLTDYLIGII